MSKINDSNSDKHSVTANNTIGLSEYNKAYEEGLYDSKDVGFFKIVFTSLFAGLAALFIISIVFLVGGSTSVYRAYYSIFPALTDILSPLETTCENDSIKVSADKVVINDNIVEAYLTIEDLSGSRVNESIDINNFCSIRPTLLHAYVAEVVDCDEDARKASIKVSALLEDDYKKDDVFTIQLEGFQYKLTHKQIDYDNIKLSNYPTFPSILRSDVDEYKSIVSDPDSSVAEDTLQLLDPKKGDAFSTVKYATITSYGFLDNKFHLQFEADYYYSKNVYGEIYIRDNNGNTIPSEDVIIFSTPSSSGYYYEYIFDLSEIDDLSGYTVYGDYYVNPVTVDGMWKIVFPQE